MRSNVLQKLSRNKTKIVVLLCVVALLAYTGTFSVSNYDLNLINDEQEPKSNSFVKVPGEDQKDYQPLKGQYVNSNPDSKPKLNSNLNSNSNSKFKQGQADLRVEEVHKFWAKIFKIYDENNMELGDSSDKLIEYTPKENQIDEPGTKKALLSRAKISDETVAALKERHSRVVKGLPEHLSELTYKKGTTGVVFIGGGKFSWLTYLAILALRETGTKLPVEVVMPDVLEYNEDKHFCEKMLPELGAKCLVVTEVLGDLAVKDRSFKSYQFKSIALAISSFQHILLLDSDNMIISNPELIFRSSLYLTYGMITWPDYWKRTIYPKYYEIADLEVNENKRARVNRFPLFEPINDENGLYVEKGDPSVPFHDLENAVPDLSTESGQFIINKGTHGKTILLSLYYNIYGPKIFYKLFSLGEQGEGDKDTFITAAAALKQPHYQVKSFIMSPGYFDDNHKFNGVAMAQKNPLVDYERFQDLIVKPFKNGGEVTPVADQIENLNVYADDKNDQFGSYNGIPVFAIHCNHPKLDPITYLSREDLYDKSENKLKYRLYNKMKYNKSIASGNNGASQNLEIDFEYEQWLHIHETLCLKKYEFQYFKGQDMDQLCEFAKNQVNWLAPDETSM